MISSTNSQRLKELDALRGIAALAVVLYHYTSRYDRVEGLGYSGGSPFELYIGKFGVELFFMISGFVIFMSMGRLPSSLGGFKIFALSRFSRLYPAFWASVLITFSVVSVFGLSGQDLTLAQLLANLTMIPGIIGVRMVDGVYWTLEKELLFYFWMAVILLLNGLKKIRSILIFWLLLSVVSQPLTHILGCEHHFIYKAFKNLVILQWIPFFAIGILAYLKYSTGRYRTIDFLLIGLCLLRISQDKSFLDVLAIVSLLLAFHLLATHRLCCLNARPLVFLGTISYSLYLVHQNIGYIIIREALPFFGTPWLPWAIATLASLILASCITFFVEKPVMLFIRRPHRYVADKSTANSNV